MRGDGTYGKYDVNYYGGSISYRDVASAESDTLSEDEYIGTWLVVFEAWSRTEVTTSTGFIYYTFYPTPIVTQWVDLIIPQQPPLN